MSELVTVRGFEEVWRPAALPRRRPEEVLGTGGVGGRLSRIVRGAPEVMVKVTGRTRGGVHLKGHIAYISRNGALELEDEQGWTWRGRAEAAELARDWAEQSDIARPWRKDAPLSHALMLSMPAGTDAEALRLAARAFAAEVFAERFDYVFALHTDTDHPHVHLTVRSAGRDGSRLNPKKGDLEAWRQVFAQALRDRGVEAEATPRRARGVTRKPQRMAMRRMADRSLAGLGPMPRTETAALKEAAGAAFAGDVAPRPWEAALAARQGRIRGLYLAQAEALAVSLDPGHRALGAQLEAFVGAMPAPDSRRLALARRLRGLQEKLVNRRQPPQPESRDRED
ncbi:MULTISPECIES: relaxase/mobilization nuclease domain-containing protein [unclassified Phenylobacterium]|uniref:relaxase/mobilization nuclease domain-containing protein n=1 Tax=unclassified Phenylobacterium TaxID=2640670 RepID=UPI0009EBB352|nr:MULTISPECIES: relaxase/mobilization nuclease domain-containing protein [unclassified Phenylobacterium]